MGGRAPVCAGTALLIAAASAAATKLSRMERLLLEREPRPIHRLCFYGTHPILIVASCQQLVLQPLSKGKPKLDGTE
jgi:hypothetical protein